MLVAFLRFEVDLMTEERKERLQKRIENIKAALDQYYEAELAILGGAQQYSLGSRSLTRANLAEVRRAIKEYENLLDKLISELNGTGRMRMTGAIPIDI